MSTIPLHLAAELCCGRQDPPWRLALVSADPSRSSHSSLSVSFRGMSLPMSLPPTGIVPSLDTPVHCCRSQLTGICWPPPFSIDSGVYPSSAGWGCFQEPPPCCLQQWHLFPCLLGSVSTFAPSVHHAPPPLTPASAPSCHLSIPRRGPVSALQMSFANSLSSSTLPLLRLVSQPGW